MLTLVDLSSCICLTSTHIFMHTCIENTQQGRCNAIFLMWLLREQGADVLAHIISSSWFVNSKLANKFTKLSVHDAIISSIYNTQDTAKLVWEGWKGMMTVEDWQCTGHFQSLTVTAWLSASQWTHARAAAVPHPRVCVCFKRELHNLLERAGKTWSYKYTIRVVPLLCKALTPGLKTPGKKQHTMHISKKPKGNRQTLGWKKIEHTQNIDSHAKTLFNKLTHKHTLLCLHSGLHTKLNDSHTQKYVSIFFSYSKQSKVQPL